MSLEIGLKPLLPFGLSRVNAPVELATRYTTPDNNSGNIQFQVRPWNKSVNGTVLNKSVTTGADPSSQMTVVNR